MQTQNQQRQIFQRGERTLQGDANNTHSYRCYLRRPNMQAQIENINADQTVQKLKEVVKTTLKISVDCSSLKLIVNEIELKDQMSLTEHLHQNAIIHVLVNLVGQQGNSQEDFVLKIKEPPMSCPVYDLSNVSTSLRIEDLKQKIRQYYESQHNDEDISRLQVKQIYLVYGGQILQNTKTLKDYQIDKNGIVYVVNGNKYVRQVTREQAEKRIRQVRNRQTQQTPSIVHAQVSESKQQEHVNNTNNFQSDVNATSNNDQDFVIVQNMIYDEDSQGEGEVKTSGRGQKQEQVQSQADGKKGEYSPSTMSRSQKIIHRYDSLKNNIQDNSEKQQTQRAIHQNQNQQNDFVSKISQVHEGSELDQNRNGRTAALENYLPTQTQENVVVQNDNDGKEHNIQADLNEEPVDRDTITSYVSGMSQKVSQSQELQQQTQQNLATQQNVAAQQYFAAQQKNVTSYQNVATQQNLIGRAQNKVEQQSRQYEQDLNQPQITEEDDLLA